MKKVWVTALLLFCISNIANASTQNGEFEGNPIVKVQSNEQELKVEDVPAINYKGRTMVPIYLLRQLGAEVTWNEASYSVNVAVDKKRAVEPTVQAPSQEEKERELLKNMYSVMNNLDHEIWMIAERLEKYASLDDTKEQSYVIANDLQALDQQHIETITLALEVSKKIKANNKIKDIMENQDKAMKQLKQTKNTIDAWLTVKTDTTLEGIMRKSIFYTVQASQSSMSQTNKAIRELTVQDIRKQLQ